MSVTLAYVITGVIAYLLGSISTGILVAQKNHGPNLREVGSKNTGASNVLRTMGLKSGLITFVGDCGKAAVACLIGRWLLAPYGASLYGAMLAGLLVILGHNWPVFFQFKGGKGVASSCGVMLVCFPLPAIICFVFCLALIYLSKYISLGSMSMLTLYAFCVFPECGELAGDRLERAAGRAVHSAAPQQYQRLCRGKKPPGEQEKSIMRRRKDLLSGKTMQIFLDICI